MYLNVSNIQHFSVGDGRGIRTTVFLKGCNLCCPWCHNPETISPVQQTLFYPEIERRKICGQRMLIEDIAAEILCDRDFYVESGGGATISGGEPMLQPEGVAVLAARLKREGVSVIIDTAGNVPYAAFETVNDFVDGYLFDYKAGTSAQYAQVIGGDLALIHENLKQLLIEKRDVRVRIPLIPGFNTGGESISVMCRNLRELGAVSVDLLPFHRMGIGKYRALGLEYAYRETELLSGAEIESIRRQYGAYFQTTVE